MYGDDYLIDVTRLRLFEEHGKTALQFLLSNGWHFYLQELYYYRLARDRLQATVTSGAMEIFNKTHTT